MFRFTWFGSILLGAGAYSAPLQADTATSYQQHGHVLYAEEPRIMWLPPRIWIAVDPDRWVMVTKGTVLASELLAVPQAQVGNELQLDLPERLGGDVPAASQFSLRIKKGTADACLMRPGPTAAAAFIQVCLLDSNGDGLYDMASRGSVTTDIQPVRLRPVAAPRDATRRIQRSLVVSDVQGDTISLTIRYVARDGGNYCMISTGKVREGQFRLPLVTLSEHASARVNGLRVEARKSPAGYWWVNARGSFPSWTRLTDAATTIDADGMTMSCIR